MIRKFTTALIAAAALIGSAHAQVVEGLDGRWEGALDADGMTLHVVMRVATANGATTAVLDSPDQDTIGIPATLTRTGAAAALDVPSILGSFKGALGPDGKTLTGAWSQGGVELPLTLTRK